MFNTLKILKTMKIKKLFAIAALLLGSTGAFAATQEYTYEGLIYILDDGAKTATVKKVSDDATYKAKTTWVIPEKFKALAANGALAGFANEEFNVVGFADNAFAGNTVITSVTFAKPANIKTIGAAAFKGCTALTSFAIGDEVTTIGAEAFSGCTAMTELTFGKKVAAIGSEFIKGTAITTLNLSVIESAMIRLGESIAAVEQVLDKSGAPVDEATATASEAGIGTAVGQYAEDPENAGKYYPIATAAAPASVKGNVFESTTLEEIIFTSFKTDGTPDKHPGVGYTAGGDVDNQFPADAFKNCVKLASIVLPADLEALPDNIFKYGKIATLDLSYLSALGAVGNIFGGSANAYLTTVKLPTTLGDNLQFTGTFAGCTGLTSLAIPAGWAPAVGHPVIFPENSLKGSGLTTVTFTPNLNVATNVWDGKNVIFAVNAFAAAANPRPITFSTISEYVAVAYYGEAGVAPNGMTYEFSTFSVKEITLNGNYALLCQAKAYRVPVENGVVYSLYLDNDADGTVYMVPFKIQKASYQVPANKPVLVKAKQKNDNGKLEIQVLDGGDGDMAASVLRRSDDAITMITDVPGMGAGLYCNVAAIKNGVFGIGAPTESYLNNKTYYVISKKQYGAAGARIVWLDEDDATAIKTIKAKAGNNGAIYNLAGQKVNASYKGVVIKDGKKYIQK